MNCCSDSKDVAVESGTLKPQLIALAGNPNSGKTTIFNALTGLRQKVGNYPGVTVERKIGRMKLPGMDKLVDVIDLPGTYSLVPRSPDERISMEILRGLRPGTPRPDIVVMVVDASNLQRNLFLVSQLIEMELPLVIVLNMMDVAERRGQRVDAEKLQLILGVPVVKVVGHKGQGIDKILGAIPHAQPAPMPIWPLQDAMLREVESLGRSLAEKGVLSQACCASSYVKSPDKTTFPAEAGSAEKCPVQPVFEGCVSADARMSAAATGHRLTVLQGQQVCRYHTLAERLLTGDVADDMATLSKEPDIRDLVAESHRRLGEAGVDPTLADIEAHYRWIESVVETCVTFPSDDSRSKPAAATSTHGNGLSLPQAQPSARTHRKTWSDRADSLLMHPVLGLVFFMLIMGSLFVCLFWVADPMIGTIENLFSWMGSHVGDLIPPGVLRDLVTDGIIAGIGGAAVFVPQIAMLFIFLAILEDSGYLARAAFLMDRLLSRVGLHGKSFIPLLSSFACAIPGILAARTIESKRERLATIFVAPFMSCSARIPVYTLLIGTFFAASSAMTRGGILLSLYLLGIVVAVVTAWIFSRIFRQGPRSAFILEMPQYKIPQVSQVARTAWVNVREFLVRAGTIIAALSILIWAIEYFPHPSDARQDEIRMAYHDTAVRQATLEAQDEAATATVPLSAEEIQQLIQEKTSDLKDQEVRSEILRNSIAGWFGHAIEPAIKPLGYDWKMGVGLVGAFAAREVFNSTMAITYAVSDDDTRTDLRDAMVADRYADGTPVWNVAVAASMLVWFVIAMQCLSTVAVVKREMGSWKWALGMIVYMNALAYVVALVTYQVGIRLIS